MVNRACTVPITQQVLFPVFSFFPSFQLWFLWKSMAGYLLWDMLRYALSISPFGSSPFSPFFPSGRNPILPIWKSSVAIPLFVFLHSGSPRRFPLAPWEVASYFLLFCWVFWRLWLLHCFLFSFLVLFFWTVLIFLWLCLCAWKDLRLLVVAEDPSYFSLISCHGFLFLLDASSFGLQAFWTCHFFFFCGPLAPAS